MKSKNTKDRDKKMIETSSYVYKPTPWTSLRHAIEMAINIACATGKNIIIEINNTRFAVNRNTDMQTAINTYLDVRDKITKIEQQLKQNEK